MSVAFIRHGEAQSNIRIEEGIVGSNLSLTKEGIRQSKLTARHLARAAFLSTPIYNTIFSSPYRRTHETAEIFADQLGLDIATDERLAEIQKGDWHGKPVPEVIELEGEVDEENKPFFRPPNGENWSDVANRMSTFTNEAYARSAGMLVIAVSHNHPIQMGIGKLLNLPIHHWEDRPVRNASLTIMHKTSQGWRADENYYDFRPDN